MLFGTGVAMRLRTMQAGPLMQMPVFLMLFLAPVWVPLRPADRLGADGRRVNPITLVLEAGRGFLAGDPTEVLPAFGVALVLVCGDRAVGARRPAQRRARRLAGGGRLRRWPTR